MIFPNFTKSHNVVIWIAFIDLYAHFFNRLLSVFFSS